MTNQVNLVARMKDHASKQVGKLDKGLAGLKRTAGTVGHSLVTLGKVMAGLAAVGIVALTAGLGKAVQRASDLDESMNKVRVVFDKAAKPLIEFSRTTARSLGISQQKALEALGTFGNLFRAMKIGLTPSKNMSKSLLTLAADLASFNNASPEDVLLALRAGLVGETEPLRKFGINLNDARLRQEALRLGLVKTTKETLPAAAKAQAAYSLIMKDSALAQGDFARTSGGLANQQRIAAAVIDDSMAKIGAAILPIAAKILPLLVEGIATGATFLNDKLIPAVSRWYEQNKPLINQIVAFAGGVLGAFVDVARTVAGVIGTVLGKVTKWTSENKPLIATVTTFAGGVLRTLVSVLGSVASFIGKVVNQLVRWFDSITANKGVMNALRAIVGFIADAFGRFSRQVGAAISRLMALIRWVKEAIEWLAKLDLGTPGGGARGPNAPYHPQYNPVGARAMGGPVWPGGSFLVGERGPELFRPNTAGSIVPNNALGGTQIIQLVVDGRVLAEVVDKHLSYEAGRAPQTRYAS